MLMTLTASAVISSVAPDAFTLCTAQRDAVRWVTARAAGREGLRRSGRCFALPHGWTILSSRETRRTSTVLVRTAAGRRRMLWSPDRIGDD